MTVLVTATLWGVHVATQKPPAAAGPAETGRRQRLCREAEPLRNVVGATAFAMQKASATSGIRSVKVSARDATVDDQTGCAAQR